MKYLIDTYRRQIESAFNREELSRTCYDNLRRRAETIEDDDLDELETQMNEYNHVIKHAEYYKFLDRIEKGEKMLEAETDPAKKLQYSKLLKSLVEKMERVRPE